MASAVGCVREHTLFEAGGGTGGAAGAFGTDSGGDAAGNHDGNDPSAAEPWTQETCVAAITQGQMGAPCVGPFSCTAMVECCQLGAKCADEQLVVTKSCKDCTTPMSCTSDADCGTGRLCDAFECRDCPVEQCPSAWLTIGRNGCNVCVPPNKCKQASGDPSCGEDQPCAAGLSCLPSCKGDPACCFGNQCTLPECPTLDGADCLVVGCPAASTCKVVGEPVACKCDLQVGKWTCEAPPANVCVPR